MKKFAVIAMTGISLMSGFQWAFAEEDPNKNILKQALLGAGTGAISAEASGGKAGKGALIGAGTNVIGNALLGALSGPSQQQSAPQYVQQAPVYVEQAPPGYYQPAPSQYATQPGYGYAQAPVGYQAVVVEEPVAQEDPNKKIIKQGLLGAGTGAIAASASGGKAGKGALIGAGTNVIGGALLDTLTGPSQPQTQKKVYYQPVQTAPVQSYPAYQQPQVSGGSGSYTPKKKIIRKYDSDGRVISEEEVWE